MRKGATVCAAMVMFATIGAQFARAQSMDFMSQLIDQALAAPKTSTVATVAPAFTTTAAAATTTPTIAALESLVATLDAEFKALIAAKSASSASCTITKNLSLGSTGPNVSCLQKLLISQGLLGASSATGYYGKITQTAAEKFQKANHIVSSGSPATTGYGAVGPRTRAALNALIQTTITAIPSPSAASPISISSSAFMISNLTIATTTSTATISWTTSTSSNSTINYGLTTNYGTVASSALLSTTRSITLANLSSGTMYHFDIISEDVQGNTATSTDQSFTTGASIIYGGGGGGDGGGGGGGGGSTPDTTPPSVAITSPSSGATVSGSVTLSANASDNVAVGSVQFYVNTTPIGSASSSSPYTTTWQSASTTNGSYTLYAVAEDTSGNYATTSESITTANPTFSSIASSTATTTATITWNTNENANSEVVYGLTASYGSASSSASLVTSHSISLSALATSTTYHFATVSTDTLGNTATSSDYTITTGLSTNAPVISNISYGTPTTTAAIITWNTDENSNSEVVYGTSTAYGSASSSASLVTSHSITISSLATSTTYHFAIVSTNGSGQTSTSTDQTFTTASSGGSGLAALVGEGIPGPSQALFNAPIYTCVNNYYVSTSGSDSNSGSFSSPWLTIQHADSVSRTGGDCINVEPGTYAGGGLIANGGTSASPTGYVVYRCTQLDACKITESDHGFRMNSPSGGGPNYLIFDGFELAASSPVSYGVGVALEETGSNPSSHHIWVMNNIIHGYGQSGVDMDGGDYLYYIHNTTFDNSNVTCDAQGSGLTMVVPKAAASYSPTTMDQSFSPFHMLMEYNVTYNNALTQCGSSGSQYDTDGNGIIMDTFNTRSNNSGNSVNFPYQSLVAYNISYNNGGGGVHIFDSDDVTVANNTVYNNYLDPYDSGSARGMIDTLGSYADTIINNIAVAIQTPPPTSPCGNDYAVLPNTQWNNAILGAPETSTSTPDTFSNNITYLASGAIGCSSEIAMFSPDTYSSSANKENTNPTWVNVGTTATGTENTLPSGANFALQAGSPAIGYGLTEGYLASTSVDVGACPSSLGTCAPATVISSISSGTPGNTTATIMWTTSQLANAQVTYGTTTSYGSASSSAFFNTAQSITITGLAAGTTYHYAVLSTNTQGGTASSTDHTFTTAALTAPTISTNAASAIASTTATVNGAITNTGGANATQSGFAYSTSSSLSIGVSTSTLGSQSGTASFQQNLTGLTANTTYYYRAYATNTGGTAYGSIQSFSTGESIVVFLTSGTSWSVPSNWNSSANTIEVIGGGGASSNGATTGDGGGGGGYSKVTNVSLTPSATVALMIGAGGASASASGGATYLCNSSSNCASISVSDVLRPLAVRHWF